MDCDKLTITRSQLSAKDQLMVERIFSIHNKG